MNNANIDSTIYAHIKITLGDITKIDVDAVVNAANTSLLGGGGVDGSIHRAAGPLLLAECRTLGGCKTGEAKITRGYNLPARHVLHTPGPVYKDGNHNEAALLASSYRSCLVIAHEKEFNSIAFPSISTGAYGYPIKEASFIALTTAASYMLAQSYFPDIHFVLFDNITFKIYLDTYKTLTEGKL